MVDLFALRSYLQTPLATPPLKNISTARAILLNPIKKVRQNSDKLSGLGKPLTEARIDAANVAIKIAGRRAARNELKNKWSTNADETTIKTPLV